MTLPLPARAFDPADREAPINAMLDLAEQAIRIVIEHGGEAALRARIDRLMPLLAPPAAEADHDRAIAFANVLTALRAVEGRRMTEAQFQQIAAAKSFVLGEMEIATAGVVRKP